MKGKSESKIRQFSESKPRFEAMQKNGVVNGVKGSRKIKKTEASDLLLTHGSDNVVVYSK